MCDKSTDYIVVAVVCGSVDDLLKSFVSKQYIGGREKFGVVVHYIAFVSYCCLEIVARVECSPPRISRGDQICLKQIRNRRDSSFTFRCFLFPFYLGPSSSLIGVGEDEYE